MDIQKYLTYYLVFSFILACNSISLQLILFDSLQSQLLFDVLCFKMDHVVMKQNINLRLIRAKPPLSILKSV